MKKFVICIDNSDYEVSLERNKIYLVVPDKKAEKHAMIKIVDESGFPYMHPLERFIEIKVPKNIEKVVAF